MCLCFLYTNHNNNVSVGVAPNGDNSDSSKSTQKKNKTSETVTPETTAPYIKTSPPTSNDEDSDVLHGPGVNMPKNNSSSTSPGPSVSTEGPGGQVTPILIGPGE